MVQQVGIETAPVVADSSRKKASRIAQLGSIFFLNFSLLSPIPIFSSIETLFSRWFLDFEFLIYLSFNSAFNFELLRSLFSVFSSTVYFVAHSSYLRYFLLCFPLQCRSYVHTATPILFQLTGPAALFDLATLPSN